MEGRGLGKPRTAAARSIALFYVISDVSPCWTTESRYPVGYSRAVTADEKAKLLRRLARIEGQAAGLKKMVEEDRYCIDVLTQIAAVRSALSQAGVELVSHHMEHCLLGHGKDPSAHPDSCGMSHVELTEELKTALGRLID